MKNTFTRVATLFCALVFFALTANATTYYPLSTATDLSQFSSWTPNSNGSAGAAPGSWANTFDIYNTGNTNLTIAANWAPNGATINIGNGTTVCFTIPTTYSITLTGVTVSSVGAGATLMIKNSNDLTFLAVTTTCAATSTVWYWNLGTATTFPVLNSPGYGTVIIDSTNYTNTTSKFYFQGNFILQGNGAFNGGANTSLWFESGIPQTVNTNGLTFNCNNFYDTAKTAGNVTIASGSSPYTFTLNNTLFLKANAGSTFNDGGNTFIVPNNVNMYGAAAAYTLTGTLVLNGASGTQKIENNNNDTHPGVIIPALNNIIINTTGTGAVSFITYAATAQTITVNGNITVNGSGSGGIIMGSVVGPNTFYINGNYTNNTSTGLTFTNTSGVFVLNGGSAQTLQGISAGEIFPNLTINNSHGATLSSNFGVAHTLTLTSGNITLGTHNLNMGMGATISGGSSSSYVVTNSTGTMNELYSGPATYNFPVGDNGAAGDYTPMSLAFTSGTSGGIISVRTNNTEDPNNTCTTNYLTRYWVLSQNSLTPFSATPTGTFLATDMVPTNSTTINSYKWTGSKPWVLQTGEINTTSTYTISTASALTSFGPTDISGLSAPTVSIAAASGCTLAATAASAPPYTYAWNTGATTSSVSITTSGTYSLTVTDGNGLTATASDAYTLLAANATVSANVYCSGGTAVAQSAPSGGTSPYTYSWSTGATTSSITAGIGTYTLAVEDANACTATASATITTPATTNTYNFSQENAVQSWVVPAGVTQITVTAAGAAGGYDPYYYPVVGGDGALIEGVCTVTPGDIISIAVGELGFNSNYGDAGGGGGGTFVYDSNTLGLLIVGAGGGGSAASGSSGAAAGIDITTNLTTNSSAGNAAGGTGGNGGASGPLYAQYGAGGAGWISNGADQINNYQPCYGGLDRANGFAGGLGEIDFSDINAGGYGGGGGGGWQGGGGGGGYNGGGGGNQTGTGGGGGGGGSYLNGTVVGTPVANITGNGYASISCSYAVLSVSPATSTNISCNGGNNGAVSADAAGGTTPYTYAWSTSATTSTISSLTAGTYTLTVHDNHGCSVTGSVTITAPTALAANATVTQNNTACVSNQGSAQSAPSGGNTPYTYLWSDASSQTTATATGLSGGSYTVTVTDANNCSATASIGITQAPSVTASATLINNSIACNNTGSASVTPGGGNTPYTYLWSDASSQTTATATGLSGGSYTVTVTDANNCSATASIGITQAPSVTASTTLINNSIACNNTGSASVTPGGGNTPYTYLWSDASSQTTATATGLSGGSYTVTVTDANNCSATASIGITQAPSVTASATLINNSIACNNTGSASVTPGGGNTPYTYLWSDASSQTTATATGLSGGSYTVTVTDANNCSATASIGITQAPSVTASTTLINNSIACNNTGSASVTPGGGNTPYTYLWSDASSQTTATATGLSGGSYTVTVTDANNCSATASIGITQAPSVTASTTLINNSIACNNTGSASVTPGGGNTPYTYLWSDASSQTTATATGLSGGSYTVTVTDANNCSATASIGITQAPSVTASTTLINNSIACNNTGSASVTPGGGNTPYTYLWSDASSQTTATATGLSGGSYTVTVTDANNCSATASIGITQAPSVTASTTLINNSIACNNTGSASVTPGGGNTPYTYLWSDASSQTTATATGLSGGSYTVTVTDANNCSATASIGITQAPSVTANASVTANVNCYGNATGSALSSPTGGNSPYTYLWSNASTTSSVSNLSAGTYSVQVTDANNCSATASVTITQPASALSVAITSVTNISCFGGDGSATANGSGGISPYTYSWNDANTTSGPTLTAPAGTYTVTAMDANGCTATTSVTISQPSAFIYVATGTINNVSCNGGSNGVITSTPVGGNSPFTYSWSNGSTTVSTLQTATGLSAGSYTVSVTDNCNVTKTASAIVTQPNDMRDSVRAALTVNIGCNGGNGGSATLGCKGGSYPYSYLWSNGSTLITATGLSAGTYSVVVTDQNGCTNTVGGITITQPNAIVETLASITYPLCNGEKGSASISVSGGTSPYSYTWTGGYSTTATATAIPAGNYTVTVKDAHNCSSSYTFTMTQPGAIRDSNVAAAKVNITCGGNNNGSISIGVKYGTSPYTYTWTPNVSSTNTASGLSAGTYSVSVMDSHGCSGSTAVISITQPNILRDSVAFTDNVGCYGGNGGEISIGVRGGSTPYTYSWSNGKTSYLITGLTAGTYSVTITDHNNCSNQLTGIVISQPAAPISSTFSTTCVGNSEGTVTVMASGGTSPYSYTWSNGSTKTSFTFSNGTYTVTVKDAHGCSATNSVTVSCPAAPEAPPQERKGDEPPPPPGCCPSLIDVNLYPNPNTGQFTLSGLTQGMVIDIFDYTGRRISTIIASDVTMQLNIADQPNGIYLIRISGKDGTFLAQKKVVKTQ